MRNKWDLFFCVGSRELVATASNTPYIEYIGYKYTPPPDWLIQFEVGIEPHQIPQHSTTKRKKKKEEKRKLGSNYIRCRFASQDQQRATYS